MLWHKCMMPIPQQLSFITSAQDPAASLVDWVGMEVDIVAAVKGQVGAFKRVHE